MKLKLQKRIAAEVLNCSEQRVQFDVDRLDEIKEAITKADIRGLIIKKAITAKKVKGISRARARYLMKQKSKTNK